jgi:DNA helicase MCM8
MASLPARTSIIAAANPVDGHYNRAKTIQENLKMGPAMLSRWAWTCAAGGRAGGRAHE